MSSIIKYFSLVFIILSTIGLLQNVVSAPRRYSSGTYSGSSWSSQSSSMTRQGSRWGPGGSSSYRYSSSNRREQSSSYSGSYNSGRRISHRGGPYRFK